MELGWELNSWVGVLTFDLSFFRSLTGNRPVADRRSHNHGVDHRSCRVFWPILPLILRNLMLRLCQRKTELGFWWLNRILLDRKRWFWTFQRCLQDPSSSAAAPVAHTSSSWTTHPHYLTRLHWKTGSSSRTSMHFAFQLLNFCTSASHVIQPGCNHIIIETSSPMAVHSEWPPAEHCLQSRLIIYHDEFPQQRKIDHHQNPKCLENHPCSWYRIQSSKLDLWYSNVIFNWIALICTCIHCFYLFVISNRVFAQDYTHSWSF